MARRLSGYELDSDLMSRSLAGSTTKEEEDEEEEDDILSNVVPGSEYLVTNRMGAEDSCFLSPADGDGPSCKRFRPANVESEDDVEQLPVKQLLRVIHRGIIGRLNSLDRKMDAVALHCQGLEQKVQAVEEQLRLHPAAGESDGVSRAAAVGALPKTMVTSNGKVAVPYSSNGVKLVTLNSEEDFPDGTWLGDASCVHKRVRCHIPPSDLKTVEETSHTPEKMALTLLDFLFDRETQACSNISGQGKQGKKQLDPLLIFGIRCHLQKWFGTGDKEWQRIKTNLDSKCRTAHRRKVLGMPLLVKAFKDKAPSTLLPINRAAPAAPSLCVPDDSDQGGCLSDAGSSNSSQGARLIADDAIDMIDITDGFCEVHHFPMAVNEDVPGAILVSDDNDPCSVLVRNVDLDSNGHPVEIALLDGEEEEESRIVDLDTVDHTSLDLGLGEDALTDLRVSGRVDSVSALDLSQHTKVLRTLQGDIQVLHATPEQLLEIQRTCKIQILRPEDFLGFPGEPGSAFSVPLAPHDLKAESMNDCSESEDHVILQRHPVIRD